MKWIAHRGESYDAPENTRAAIDCAMEQGADGVEIDVRLTADQRIVLMHDATTGRTCSDDYQVEQVSYETLSTLDAGSWKGESWQGEPVPLLEDVLMAAPLVIEIKTGPEIVPVMNKLFERHGMNGAEAISFSLDVMQQARVAWPDMPLYWLGKLQDPLTLGEMISIAVESEFTGLDLHYSPEMDAQTAERIHDAGLQLYVWTVDDPDAAKRCIDFGVDGITSNRCAWLKEELWH